MGKIRSTISLLLLTMFLVACGGGGDTPDDPAVNEAGIDVQALEESLAGFNAEVESEFGYFIPPEYDDSDGTVLGFLSTGVDPVVFCDRLADYVADEGFDGIVINVRVSTASPILATGEAGSDCKSA